MSDESNGDGPSVAIACQGGGSHTAFTAGVLQRLLRESGEGALEIVGLSGTSGGAICATAAWYGLLTEGPERAIETLERLWTDVAARSPADRLANWWTVGAARFAARGGPMVAFSPYELPFASLGRDRFIGILEDHIAFDHVPALAADASLDLLVGAADVTAGEFVTFRNEAITAETLLASAAIPTLFEAVEVDGRWYWDGLFSQNPPIRDFLAGPSTAAAKPDEIWIVQINPERREAVPTTMEDIGDRRNELAGNLSLYQEVYFIERINDLLERGTLPAEYKPVDVKFIDLDVDLSASSKLDRDPSFLSRLRDRGRRRADRFLEEETDLAASIPS